VLNKNRANLWVKIVALTVTAAFVAVAALSLVNPGGQPPADSGSSAQDSDDQQALQLVTQLQQQLRANPTSTALLVELGNTYFNWADKQQQAKRSLQAQSNFALAADAYTRALGQGKDDPGVRTDLSTALFYSGDTTQAIAQGERVLKNNPTFPNALLNTGIFYASSGDSARARGLWQRYLKVAPTGGGADFVKQQLSNLK